MEGEYGKSYCKASVFFIECESGGMTMNIIDKNIDAGKAFDWGKAAEDYAKYRDIYPQEFYDRIVQRNLCIDGQVCG